MTTPSLVLRHTRRRSVRSKWFASLVAVAVAALGAGALTGSAATAATAAPSSITIKDFAFKPTPLKVEAGAKLKIANRDDTTHTFTADKGAFDTGDIAPGKTASVTLKKSGTYKYHCEIHDFMKGTVKAT